MLGRSAEKRHSPVRCPSGSRRGEDGQARAAAPRSSPVLEPQRQGGCRAEAPESGGAALGRAGTPSVKQVKWGVCRRRKATRLALNFAAPVTNKQIQTRKDRSHLIPACSAAAASLIGAEVIYLFDFSPPSSSTYTHPPTPFSFTSLSLPPPRPSLPSRTPPRQSRSLRAAQRGRGCSAAGSSGGCWARGGRAAGRRARRRAGAGQPPHRCRETAEHQRELPPDAPSSEPGCGGRRMIPTLPLATVGTEQPGGGMLGDRSQKGGWPVRTERLLRGARGPRGGVLRPPPVGSPAAAVRRERTSPRCGSGGAGNVRLAAPGASRCGCTGEYGCLAVCAYGHARVYVSASI